MEEIRKMFTELYMRLTHAVLGQTLDDILAKVEILYRETEKQRVADGKQIGELGLKLLKERESKEGYKVSYEAAYKELTRVDAEYFKAQEEIKTLKKEIAVLKSPSAEEFTVPVAVKCQKDIMSLKERVRRLEIYNRINIV